MIYSHIIWDWNGTLLDDTWLCLEIVNKMLTKRNLPFLSTERYAEIFNFPVKVYYEQSGFDFSITPFEILSDEFITEYDHRKSECTLRDHAMEVLNQIQSLGISQSIVSASKQTSLVPIVEHYGIHKYFSGINGLSDHHAAGKIAVGKRWMDELALPPGNVLMVGDTLHDAEMTAELGIDCVLIFSGHQSSSRLETANVPILKSLLDILTLLKSK